MSTRATVRLMSLDRVGDLHVYREMLDDRYHAELEIRGRTIFNLRLWRYRRPTATP